MKSDAEIRDDIINELHWDQQVTRARGDRRGG